MKKKLIIAICAVIFIALVFIIVVSLGRNPVKNTSWKSEESILKFGDADFSWESADVVRKGSYTIYKGKSAEKAIKRYIKEYNKFDTLEDDSAVNELKDRKFFVMEEKTESLTCKGEDVPFSNEMYVGSFDGDYLRLVNVRTKAPFILTACNKDAELEHTEHYYGKGDVIDNNLTSDKNVPFTYKVADGYKKLQSNQSGVRYENSEGYIFIAVLKDIPFDGIIGQYPIKDKFADGYLVTESSGAKVEYLYAIPMGDDTVFVWSNDKAALEAFAKTINLENSPTE